MNELTDVPIDRIPLSSLPGNLPPPRPPASVSTPPPLPPKSEPVAESPAPPPPPQPRWVKEALGDLLKWNRKKGIALSAAGSLVTAALAMNALFSGASQEPAEPAPVASQPAAQAAPPEAEPQRDVPPPEPVVPTAPPPTAKITEHRESAAALPTVELAPIPTSTPPTTAPKPVVEQVATTSGIKPPDLSAAASEQQKPASSPSGGIPAPIIIPAMASEPAPVGNPAPPVGGVAPPPALPGPIAAPAIPAPQDLTKPKIDPTADKTKPIVPNINPANSIAESVKRPIALATPKIEVAAKEDATRTTSPAPTVPAPILTDTTPKPPAPALGDKKPDPVMPPIGDTKASPIVPAIGDIKLDPPAPTLDKLKLDPLPTGRAATLTPPEPTRLNPPAPNVNAPAIPAPRVEKQITPVEAPKPRQPAPTPFGGLNEAPTRTAPDVIAPKLTPAPVAETVTLTKPAAAPDVRQTGAKTLPPARTSFDVDIHYPKAVETYASISKLHYGDARYAAALQAFNQGRALGQGGPVEIPPIYILRQRAAPTGQPARPTRNGLAWASSGPTTTAPTYSVPRDGMTMWDVAAELYGDRQQWRKVWDVNQRTDPNEQLTKGTKLQLPPDAR